MASTTLPEGNPSRASPETRLEAAIQHGAVQTAVATPAASSPPHGTDGKSKRRRKRSTKKSKCAAVPEEPSVSIAPARTDKPAMFATCASTLVVDAGPIIRRTNLWSLSDNFVTTEGVLAEIRDPGAREWLARTPVPIVPRVPAVAALATVGLAARETGDFSALSAVDLSVIALAWQLHAEAKGIPLRRGGSKTEGVAASPLDAEKASATKAIPVWSSPAPWAKSGAASAAGGAVEAGPEDEAADAPPAQTGKAPAAVTAATPPPSQDAAASGASGGDGRFEDADEDEDDAWVDALDAPTREARMAALAHSTSAAARAASAAGAPEPTHSGPGTSFPSLGSLAAAGKLVPTDASAAPGVWRGPARKLPATVSGAAGAPVAAALPAAGAVAATPRGGAVDELAAVVPVDEDAAADGGDEVVMEGDAEDVEQEEDGADAAVGGGSWASPAVLAAADARGADVSSLGFDAAFTAGIAASGGAPSQAVPAAIRPAVACVTTDFACQNVLMHMGVPVVGLDGRRVKQLRRWVLKCDACFFVTAEMGRLFCPQCGGSTLRRLACTRTAKGRTIFHYSRTKANPSLRGTQYSLPTPKGGRSGDMLLREDQLLTGRWKQRAQAGVKPRESFLTDAAASFGGEWAAAESKATRRFATSEELLSSVRGAPAVVVGLGRNPNSAKGRERRGQKTTKRPGKGRQ